MRVLFLSGLLALAACSQAPADAATAKFPLANFDQVALQGPDSVRVVGGSAFAVETDGPQEALDQLDLRVEQGTLKVRRKQDKDWHWDWRRSKARAQITVTLPVIRGASLSGAGDLDVRAPTAKDQFVASLSGAGDLRVANAGARMVEIRLSGAGNIRLDGAADQLVAGVSGSGNVDARGLATRTARLNVSGVGNIHARVSESVTGGVSGVGNVDVVGGARCTLSKSGVGSVHCAP